MNIIQTFFLTNNENNLIELQDKNKLILGTYLLYG